MGGARAHAGRFLLRRLAVPLAVILAACSDASSPAGGPAVVPMRAGRFGSLRDLVLFARPELAAGRALFCDRFEVTRGDWAEFAAAPAGRAVDAGRVPTDGEPSVAVGLVDLSQARAFARWRFLRLPRRDEWQLVALDGGRSRFPWGDRVDPSRANTAELGLWQATPVGTFESGRQAGGANPYDLIGNVSEWTESPVAWWYDARQPFGAQPLDPLGGLGVARRRVAATPALAAWCGPAGLAPPSWLLRAVDAHVPRDVVGADFAAPMEDTWQEALPDDRSARRGLRLFATAGELVAALVRHPDDLSPQEAAQVQRFVARDAHRAVLAATWRELTARGELPVADGPLARLLARELGVRGEGR